MLKFLAFFLCSTALLCSHEEEAIAKRIYNHVTIGDYRTGIQEAYSALGIYPDSQAVYAAALTVLAASHEDARLFALWNEFTTKFPEEQNDRKLLELLAWSVLEQGSHSTSPILRLMAMLGAYFSNDAKGLPILLRGLSDCNSYARSIAVRLAADLPDKKIRTAIINQFKKESAFSVRLALIEAIGKLKIKELRSELITLSANPTARDEERKIAVEALVSMAEVTEAIELTHYVLDSRAGIRLLACQAAVHSDRKQEAPSFIPLLNDSHADVRLGALQTIGLLHPELSPDLLANANKTLCSYDYKTAITTAWLLILYEQPQGFEVIDKWLQHADRKVRIFAAAALKATGKFGAEHMAKAFEQSHDPYVRLNLSLGLIGQRIRVQEACQAIYEGLTQTKEKWSWQEYGVFRILAPNLLSYDEEAALSPEEVNQTTRLEVWNILAMMKHPMAKEAMQNYLRQKTWGITGIASALLLTECDDSAIDIVQSLLTDPNPKIRIQAALILALWGSGQEALPVLETAYEQAERQMKERILEGIGRVGSPASIPFLAKKLQEPQLSLRIIAAFALLQCLHK